MFLVNPHQMDLIYPSEYCRALDPEIVRELLLSIQEEDDLLDILVRREEDQRGWSKYSEMVTVGLYLKLGSWSRQRREAVLEKGDTSMRSVWVHYPPDATRMDTRGRDSDDDSTNACAGGVSRLLGRRLQRGVPHA